MDVALLASNEDVSEPFAHFCREHLAPFTRTQKAITALLTAGTLGLIGLAFVGDALCARFLARAVIFDEGEARRDPVLARLLAG